MGLCVGLLMRRAANIARISGDSSGIIVLIRSACLPFFVAGEVFSSVMWSPSQPGGGGGWRSCHPEFKRADLFRKAIDLLRRVRLLFKIILDFCCLGALMESLVSCAALVLLLREQSLQWWKGIGVCGSLGRLDPALTWLLVVGVVGADNQPTNHVIKQPINQRMHQPTNHYE